jgi:phosphatidate cytidylyltransferase
MCDGLASAIRRLPLLADTGGVRALDTRTIVLLSVVLGLLAVAFVVGQLLKRQPDTVVNPAMVKTFNHRVRAWWLMSAILIAAFLVPDTWATVAFFGLIGFWALREFITLTPTRLGDHRALFWVFFLITPLQFVLVGMGYEYYGLYSVLIPMFVVLFIPARIALAGDFKRFLERTAKIQAGLLICVYSLSFAPALLHLTEWKNWHGSTAGLLFYFIVIAQMSDVLQYVWDKMLGRRVIAPTINASKTWEGLFGGGASTALLGAALYWVTPFNPWQSASMSLIVAGMGFAGTMTMSAIKRDRGVSDYGSLVEGHAGVLDRIDSICFAAPVFYQLTRLLFTNLQM